MADRGGRVGDPPKRDADFLTGWDHSRPVAIAWLDEAHRAFLQHSHAILFDHEVLPLHFRVLVPATNADELVRSLQRMLASLPGVGAAANGFVFESSEGGA